MNACYQINTQRLMDVLDDFIKVGKDGRRRKRKLKYASEEAKFNFQGGLLEITYNEKTVGVEAKGKGKGCAFINWKLMAYITSYKSSQENLNIWVEDNLFHLETISVPCKWMDMTPVRL